MRKLSSFPNFGEQHKSVTKQRAWCPVNIEANITASAFEKKLYCWQRYRRHSSYLCPRSGFWSNVSELEEEGCYVLWGLRTWPFRGRYDKGASAPALPGHWTLHFWEDSDIQIISKFFGSVRGETLAPGIVWGQNFSSVCASATWLMVFCCLWKTTQYLVRKWTSLGLVLRLQKEPLVLKCI